MSLTVAVNTRMAWVRDTDARGHLSVISFTGSSLCYTTFPLYWNRLIRTPLVGGRGLTHRGKAWVSEKHEDCGFQRHGGCLSPRVKPPQGTSVSQGARHSLACSAWEREGISPTHTWARLHVLPPTNPSLSCYRVSPENKT